MSIPQGPIQTVHISDRGPGSLLGIDHMQTGKSGRPSGLYEIKPGGLTATTDPMLRALVDFGQNVARLANAGNEVERAAGLFGVDADGVATFYNVTDTAVYKGQRQMINETLWALFHNAPDFISRAVTANRDSFKQDWAAYNSVNRHMANSYRRLVSSGLVAEKGTVVVHDIHEIPVVNFLPRGVNTSLMLHTPTCTPATLAQMPKKAVTDLLGAMSRYNGIVVRNEVWRDNLLDSFNEYRIDHSEITVAPAQVSLPSLQAEASTEAVKVASQILEEQLLASGATSETKVVAMLARMDYTKGFLALARSLRVMAEEEPELFRQTRFVFTFPEKNSRQYGEYQKYEKLCRNELEAIQDIADAYADRTGVPRWKPIIRVDGDVRENALAVFKRADVFASNVFQAGLEVTPWELRMIGKKTAVLVISDGAGCASIWRDFQDRAAALIAPAAPIYPQRYNQQVVKTARVLVEALTMAPEKSRAMAEVGQAIVNLSAPLSWGIQLGQAADLSPLLPVRTFNHGRTIATQVL